MKQGKLTDRLVAARNDLVAATVAVDQIAARADDAAESAASFGKWQTELATAENEKRRLTLLVSKIEADIEAEAQQAAEAAQAKLEAEADRESSRVAVNIKKFLDAFGPAALDLLRDIAIVDIVVERANKGRKAAPPILGPEQRARWTAGRPSDVVNERVVDAWFDTFRSRVVPPGSDSHIVPISEGRGHARHSQPPAGGMVGYSERIVFEKRQVREITRLPAMKAVSPDPLAMTLVIPALAAETPLWSPPNFYEPETIIARLDAMAAAATAKQQEAKPIVEYVPLTDSEAAE